MHAFIHSIISQIFIKCLFMLGTDLGSVDTKWRKVPNFYPMTHSCHCPKSNFCTNTSILIFNEPNIFSQINRFPTVVFQILHTSTLSSHLSKPQNVSNSYFLLSYSFPLTSVLSQPIYFSISRPSPPGGRVLRHVPHMLWESLA